MLRVVLLSLSVAAVGCAADAGSGDDGATESPSALGSDAYQVYADLARSEGANPAPGTVTVLGLRGLSTTGATHETTFARVFDDTLVVLRADGTVDRFPASTHPHQSNGVSGVPDVDHDGTSDVGIIRPGIYDAVPRSGLIAGQPTFHVTRGGKEGLPGWRDTNHDGRIDDDERSASEARGDQLTAVLFHQGEGDAPPAVGCQVLPAAAIKAFVASVGGPKKGFRYVLVDMTGRDAASLPR